MSVEPTQAAQPQTQSTAPAQAAPEGGAPAAAAPEAAVSPRIVELARKEKALFRRMQEIKQREEAIKAKEAEYQSSYIPKKLVSEDPVRVLMESGMTYEQIIERIMNNQPNPEREHLSKLEAQIQAVKQAQEQSQKAQEEQRQRQYDQAVSQIRKDVADLVAANATEYESIQALGQQEAVVSLIQKTFEEEGTLLSVDEAAKLVEEHLVEEAIKLASLGKVKQKLAPPVPEAPQKQTLSSAVRSQQFQVKPRATAELKTLTNAATAAPSKSMSWADRRARAIAMLEGQQT